MDTRWWVNSEHPTGTCCPGACVLPALAFPASHCQCSSSAGLFVQSLQQQGNKGMSCGSARTYLLRYVVLQSSGQGPWRGTCFELWPLPAGGTRAAQSLFYVPHLENLVLKPQLEPLPFSWQVFFVLRKKAIVLTKWLSDTTASHLNWSARLVSHLLLCVEMCLESVCMAVACPKCPVTVMPAPASLTTVQVAAQLQHNLTYEQAGWAEEGELTQLITQVCACSLLS